MRFHHAVMMLALVLSLLTLGAAALDGQGKVPGTADLADPGYWLSIGQGLVGLQENGWCKCS